MTFVFLMVAVLIQQLGNDSFPVREAAQRDLQAFGALAMPQIETALEESEDAEVRHRCRQLLNEYWGLVDYPLVLPSDGSGLRPIYSLPFQCDTNANAVIESYLQQAGGPVWEDEEGYCEEPILGIKATRLWVRDLMIGGRTRKSVQTMLDVWSRQ